MASTLGYDGGLTASMGVKDLDAAITWYGDVLGFQLLYKLDEMAWAELKTETEGVNIGLSQVEDLSPEGGATLTFGVKDIGAARAELEGQGVRFDGDTMVIPDMVSLATFYDPDGNKMMLYQSLAPEEA
ncbi:MAG: VOC family protein [Planctomycetota bacterium]|nr:VOC family protein [Planctomycetota bacterium]